MPDHRAATSNPGAVVGPVSARDSYIAGKLRDLTNSRSTVSGMVTHTTHDTDAGGGLHSGGLGDKPQQVGGYAHMDHGTVSGFLSQFGKEFDGMSPDEQAKYHPAQVNSTPAAGGPSSGASGWLGRSVAGGLGGQGQGSSLPGSAATSSPSTGAGKDAFGTDALNFAGLGSAPGTTSPNNPSPPAAAGPGAPSASPAPPPVPAATPGSPTPSADDTGLPTIAGAAADGGYGKVDQTTAAPMAVNPGDNLTVNGQQLDPSVTAVQAIDPKYGGGMGYTQNLPADAPSQTIGSDGKEWVGPDEAARRARSAMGQVPAAKVDASNNTPGSSMGPGTMFAANLSKPKLPGADPDEDDDEEVGSARAFSTLGKAVAA